MKNHWLSWMITREIINQVQNLFLSGADGDRKLAARESIIPPNSNPYLATGFSTMPTTTRLAADTMRDLVLRGTMRPPPLPPHANTITSSSPLNLSDKTEAGTDLQVTFLVLMPSPRAEGLEYALGVMEARVGPLEFTV
ncbi:hypothetical protein FIBSPDRAFT_952917 [Athelia psychrophila]|uniref:Uncharacterized protein n=1 Tax=Athelia psychrophila TaxID=1759441 RepID=A0A166KVQ7_9AGAM|nr:hypothetical protein FIBSPDRAFT_952917 [Fibularhizoctonia sp. CBS 109695]